MYHHKCHCNCRLIIYSFNRENFTIAPNDTQTAPNDTLIGILSELTDVVKNWNFKTFFNFKFSTLNCGEIAEFPQFVYK